MTQGKAVRLVGVSKSYGPRNNRVLALHDVTVSFAQRCFTAIMGPSGSGKSTLLHCASGLDAVDEGDILVGSRNLRRLTARELTLLRRDELGFIFQSFNLVPVLTARQNVQLPLLLAGQRPARARVDETLAAVGILAQAERLPSQMSGGQQQRVAIARALITRPAVLFADEPTGALDSRTSAQILALLQELVDVHGQAVVMVTHDARAASCASRVVFLKDGQVAGELAGPTPETVAVTMARLDAA
jgi:putative ABC transport system ATP-binding protein